MHAVLASSLNKAVIDERRKTAMERIVKGRNNLMKVSESLLCGQRKINQ